MDPDPDLFIRPDGLPMVFVLSATGADRRQVVEAVEAGGGQVRASLPPTAAATAVRLLGRTEICLRKEENMFLVKYVTDCVAANSILPNLADYKIR